MRAIVLAVVAVQIGLAHPVRADDTAGSDRSIIDILPLFARNHCEEIRDPADQLFCGDPELNNVAPRLNSAIADRLNRLPNRRLAIEENAEWTRDRNSSCGIFGRQSVTSRDIKSVRDCLLRETEERIEILADPNFDCLATSTTAGVLICSDPSLALAKTELNEHVLALIAKLKENEAREAFAEFERWGRERDRKCDLANKDNVPLQELSSSEGCLADYFTRRLAEVAAAKGDPKRVFWKASAFAFTRRRRRGPMCRANPFGQRLRGFPFGKSRPSDRPPGGRAERHRDRRGRNGGSFALHGLQSDRIELHGHLLGPEVGQAEAIARKPGQFPGGVSSKN
jgi:uncharacterized protein YecT (DUF1311 family)